MKVIEQFVQGKHTDADCEDGLVITPHFIAAIDGSTSKTPRHLHPTMKNGRYCMTLVSHTLHQLAPEATVDDFCQQVTALVGSHYTGEQPPSPRERLCASAVVYSACHRQLWMVGDCQDLVDGVLYENGKPYEQQLATQRAALFDEMTRKHHDMIAGGYLVHDYARDAIIPHLLEAMEGQNKQYAVIDGTPIFRPGVKVIPVADDTEEIVLSSDGYPQLHPTLAESEAALAQQLATDPFNTTTFLATKGLMQGNRSFDDRCYVRFMPF